MSKRFILLKAMLLLGGVVLVSSCGPTAAERAEMARQDSIRVADSIAKVEADKIAAIEAAKLDSIARIEEFYAKIPSFNKLYDPNGSVEDTGEYLKSMGYTENERVNGDNGPEEYRKYVTTYRNEVDKDHYCEVIFTGGYESFGCKLIIVGAPEQFKKARQQALILKNDPKFESRGLNPWIEISENSISWGDGA